MGRKKAEYEWERKKANLRRLIPHLSFTTRWGQKGLVPRLRKAYSNQEYSLLAGAVNGTGSREPALTITSWLGKNLQRPVMLLRK